MSSTEPITSISFDGIVHGKHTSVRVTHDGLLFAVELVMVVSDLDRNQAGLSLRRVSKKELSSIKIIERSTPGTGE
jgi:hypothetical protein